MKKPLSAISKVFAILLFTTVVGCTSTQESGIIEAVSNKVDISQINLKNINQPFDNLVTGGQPTVENLTALASKGVKNIINLRSDGENSKLGFDEAKIAKSLGINYHSLPIAGAKGVSKENAQKLHDLLGQQEGNTFVHCASSNRVGALLALREVMQNDLSVEDAIEVGKSAGLKSLEGLVRKVLTAN